MGPGPMGDPYGGMYGAGPVGGFNEPYGGYAGGFNDPYGGYAPGGGSLYDPITFSTAVDFRTEVVSYLANQAGAGEFFDHFETLGDGQHAIFKHADGTLHDHGVPPERLVSCDSGGCHYEHVDGSLHYHVNPPTPTFTEVFDRFTDMGGITKAEYRHIDTSTGAVTQHVHEAPLFLFEVFHAVEPDGDVRYRRINSFNPAETEIIVRKVTQARPEPIDSFISISSRYGVLDADGAGPGLVLVNVGRLLPGEGFSSISGGRAIFDHNPDPGIFDPHAHGSGIPGTATWDDGIHDVFRAEFHEMHRHADGTLHDHGRIQEPFERYEFEADNKWHAVYRHDDGAEHDHGAIDTDQSQEPIDHYELRADGQHEIHRHPDNTLHDHGVVAGTEVIHIHDDGTEHVH